MPFWKGDQPGRPVELGRAIGERLRTLAKPADEARRSLAGRVRARRMGRRQPARLPRTSSARRPGTLPDDRTVVVERFRDELGDWRLAVHCVLGARVNAPWALAIGRRLGERYGVDAQVMPSDDGIVVRLPDIAEEPPGADLVAFDPEEIRTMVEETVGTSAMFAARFRECAARSLLLPRRDPRRRQPLWQQRQRAAQLLDVAREYADFPVTLEAARECLQDVFDVPGLVGLMRDVASPQGPAGRGRDPAPVAVRPVAAVRVRGRVPVRGRRPAGRAPGRGAGPRLHAARRAAGPGRAARAARPRGGRRDPRQLQWLTAERRARDAEDVAELLRLLGDLSDEELRERGADPAWAAELERGPAGDPGAHRRRGALDRGRGRGPRARRARAWPCRSGCPRPTWRRSPTRSATWSPATPAPMARSPPATCAARFGLGVYVVEQTLKRLAATGRVVSGEFTPGGAGTEWCDAEVLRLLRRRSLAALRREIEPVPPGGAGPRSCPAGSTSASSGRGVEAVAAAIEQLQGVPVPASALERLVLPARVADYSPAYLDELCAPASWCGPVPGRIVAAATAG